MDYMLVASGWVRFLRCRSSLTIAGFRTYMRMTERIRPANCRHGPCSHCSRGLTDDGILRTEPPEDAMSEQSRLDVLEGRVEELSRHWDRVFGEIGRLDHKIGRAFDAEVDRRGSRRWSRSSIAVLRRSIEKWTICARKYRGSFDGRSARCWRCWA